MLVLTHTTGSVIHIGDDIHLKIISVGRDKIKIGYDAPKETVILRDEVKRRQKLDTTEEHKWIAGDYAVIDGSAKVYCVVHKTYPACKELDVKQLLGGLKFSVRSDELRKPTEQELRLIENIKQAPEKCDGNHCEPPCLDRECWLK